MLKKIRIENFKGIRFFEAEFDKVNSIFGPNGAGKTTIKEALDWIHDGSATDSSVKPINGDGRATLLDTAVEAHYEDFAIRRVYHEKWQRKRGEAERTMTGHSTDYFLSEGGVELVPITEDEFKKYMASTFKSLYAFLSDPFLFGATKDWKSRRKIVFEVIGGEIPDEEVCKRLPDYENLPQILKKDTVENSLSRLVKLKNKLEKELKEKDTEIKQESKNFPEVEGNESEIDRMITEKTDEIKRIESKIDDIFKDEYYPAKIKSLEDKKESLKKDAKNKHKEKEIEIKAGNLKAKTEYEAKKDLIKKEIQEIDTKNAPHKTKIAELEFEISIVDKKYDTEKNSEFKEIDPSCPVLKIPCEKLSEDIENSRGQFNVKKSESLKKLLAEKKDIENKIESEKAKLIDATNLNFSLAEIPSPIENKAPKYSDPDFSEIDAEIEKLKAEKADKNNDLEEKAAPFRQMVLEAEKEKENLYLQKGRFETVRTKTAEIEKLKAEQKRLADQSTEAELEKMAIEAFIKKKVELSENDVIEKFGIKFKMYEEKLSGGLEEKCIPLIPCNGNLVPYEEANETSRIFYGLKLIKVLKDFYGVSPAVIIDRAGEVVCEWPQVDLQIIKLISRNISKMEIAHE